MLLDAIHNPTGIYALCCPNTKQVRYVGQSKNIIMRYAHHIYRAKSIYEHDRSPILDWINLLGIYGKTPDLIILENCDKKDLRLLEKKWISFYGIENLLNVDITKRRAEFRSRWSDTSWINESFIPTVSVVCENLFKSQYYIFNSKKHILTCFVLGQQSA